MSFTHITAVEYFCCACWDNYNPLHSTYILQVTLRMKGIAQGRDRSNGSSPVQRFEPVTHTFTVNIRIIMALIVSDVSTSHTFQTPGVSLTAKA